MAKSKKSAVLDTLQSLILTYEKENKPLPNDGTALLLGEILTKANLTRNHLARYTEMRIMLAEQATKYNLLPSREGSVKEDNNTSNTADLVPVKLLRDTQKRLSASEQRCAELRAENVSLRAKLSQLPHIESLIAQGGRFKP